MSKKPVDPDPFCVDVEPDTGEPIRPEPVVTGLSDEEDAQRHLALRFNQSLGFCRNCETVIDQAKTGMFCPRCKDELFPVGTPPRRRKHT